MEWRKNAGYIITNSIVIGGSEIVLAVHETRPNQFATWECKDFKDYFWGHYFTDIYSAQKDFCQRGVDKAQFYIENTKQKDKPPKEPER